MEKVKWRMVRGDTLAFIVQVEGGDLELDSVIFSCKTDTSATDYVFKKTLEDGVRKLEEGKYRVRVAPEDTKDLEAGTYAIDLQLGINEDIATPILGTLKILEDVTRNDGEESE